MGGGSHRSSLSAVLKSTRAPFLLLTLVCVFLGTATAVSSAAYINIVDVGLVLIGALAAHIAVNSLNEYFDFKSGLDALTTRTPFSGGSGALISRPDAAGKVLYTALGMLGITTLIGLYFVISRGWLLLPIGIAGVLIVLTYTPWLNRIPGLCLIAPGLAFGPLMVSGTHIALTGEYAALPAVVSLIPFFLSNNLLLLNQYPDMSADRTAGRRTFPIAYGVRSSAIVYGVFLLLTCVTLLLGIQSDLLPVLSSVCFIPLLAGLPAVVGAARCAPSAIKMTPFLALNVGVALLTPLLLGLAILAA